MTQHPSAFYLDEPELEKLSELRAKTDRQLHGFVHSRLDVGLSFAARADVEQSALERAGQALAEVQRLLPALSEKQRRAFGPKLAELRQAVNRLGQPSGVSPPAWRAAM